MVRDRAQHKDGVSQEYQHTVVVFCRLEVKEYQEWQSNPLDGGVKIKDCPESVIAFLQMRGYIQRPDGDHER